MTPADARVGYLATCARNTCGRAAENVCTARVMDRPIADSITLYTKRMDRGYATGTPREMKWLFCLSNR